MLSSTHVSLDRNGISKRMPLFSNSQINALYDSIVVHKYLQVKTVVKQSQLHVMIIHSLLYRYHAYCMFDRHKNEC